MDSNVAALVAKMCERIHRFACFVVLDCDLWVYTNGGGALEDGSSIFYIFCEEEERLAKVG